MKAMIFAAGLGSRLKPLTDTRPKALVTVGGKTMLEYVLLRLKEAGFDEIVINTHHFANQISAFLEANRNFGIKIHISDETDQLLDTGGGLEKASPMLLPTTDQENIGTSHQKRATCQETDTKEPPMAIRGEMQTNCCLLHNVDILSNCNLKSFIHHHQQSLRVFATLLVSRRKTSRYLLFDKDNMLCGWVNKETMATKPIGFKYQEGEYKEYAYSGIQIVNPILFKYLPKGKYSIIDFYLSMCHKIKIQAYVEDELQLIDIGKPETLEKAERFLSKL
ncbi:nucleotidyltransferase family protein [Phocaeicola sp.]|uniref:nucleotidyltransferase family protein n=1 Tax=Phocaeicola sp. TaxID=2773926 RepID=UPI0023CE486B|nr:nucleotidyltransferase family protein [Phocaeicola sp.]MDE5678799.1 nucleotidyltransferase family protein [Phocaeicola sp.]